MSKISILELWITNRTKVMEMPFISSPQYTTCKGVGLYCAQNIFGKMSKEDYKQVCLCLGSSPSQSIYIYISTIQSQIIDAYSGKTKKCLEPCTDFQYSLKTTTSSYPAESTFQNSKEACFLVMKFFETCKQLAQ